jgi:Flp pilus assembly protein TadB
LLADLDLTGTEPESFATRLLAITGACALVPLVVWLLAAMVGLPVPAAAAGLVLVVSVPSGAALTVASVVRRAHERRRHFRVVTGSFVDLVVLSLAGGVGIDGALHAASQVSPDWAAQRIGRALSTARDGGTTPWAALGALGRELRVPELVELATTVQLAGTEGARIRQSLSARAASLRRHEQAEAESAANAMTERLFLPGALLLLGFLLFIGYPAFHRILGGF